MEPFLQILFSTVYTSQMMAEKKVKILAVLSHRIILFYVRVRILNRDGNISILFHQLLEEQLFSILYYAADELRVAASQHFKNFADHEVLIKSF